MLWFVAVCFAIASVSAMSPADVKKHTVESMKAVPVGRDKAQNGIDFYKFFFTHHKDLRKFFKGAENFGADDVQKSKRFEKQGTALLLAVHVLANVYDNQAVFHGFVRELMNRHEKRGVDPKLWKIFFDDVWVPFLESKGAKLSGDAKAAWKELNKNFNSEAQHQLEKLGLPHA
ncbi:hypothetical protein Q1695_002476 [Nippostrongylus brasiliensis]|uniref:Globin, cuticular isoform n=1 Tax=Nippostrongylus brasiliensis TaxID=27835 RepID=GLBC_NIPBR|nr:RecName: Full=Globin, cuticular isoform; Flags: Precursor [Nippostrongylus brasiliensis]AAA65540.1 globin [Nippostrongylus brasiliensis]WKY10154.1 hypothetical protein Q1695_002476 [Nippostrongylus brasiliensis]